MMVMPAHSEQIKTKTSLSQSHDEEGQIDHLDLGKKPSVPVELMLEELKLHSNRGSKMFQERHMRMEKFTLENIGQSSDGRCSIPPSQQETFMSPRQQRNLSAHLSIEQPERMNLIATLQQTIAKKGNPDILAPGYGAPLRDVPPERFNTTVIPKSYSCPWEDREIDSNKLHATITARLPELECKLNPDNYRCFNRAPVPFGGTAGSLRTLPLPGFERLQAHSEPWLTWKRMCERPNFNRTPQGWAAHFTAYTESAEL